MKILFFGLLITFFLSSCFTQKEVVTNYLEKNRDTTGTTLVKLPEPTIQKSDLISIKVYSLSANPAIDAMYNLPEQTVAGSTTSATAGFLVDDTGNIEYPRLGTFHVEGLKKSELAQQIKSHLDTVLKSPSVIVRFLNYKITVLGEVRTPGTFNVPTERVTILEALGLAGDITEYGNKATVKIMRESNGQAVIHRLDLTSNEVMASPFFRLQQNDVVFVEQTGRKFRQQQQQNTAQQIGIATGVISAIALIISIIRFR